jgi:hypothetical protein
MKNFLTAALVGAIGLASPAIPARAAPTPTIVITHPSEGETLYAGPTSLIYSIQVTGWILGLDDLDGVGLTLEVVQNSAVVGRLKGLPSPDGSFSFSATVNPEGSSPNFSAPQVESGCENCHVRSSLDLPEGGLILRVTAGLSDGTSASGERRVTVDRSGYALVPVRVVRADAPGEPVQGVVVEASSRLYRWRGRIASGTTDAAGMAKIQVEALSQAPTRFVIEARPSVRDGIMYEGITSAEVVLPPRSTSHPAVVLEASARSGLIAGRIVDPNSKPLGSVDVWAIDQASLHCYQTTTNRGGGFAIRDLPVGSYVVAADPADLAEAGIAGAPQTVDLASMTRASVTLESHELPGTVVHGVVIDDGGDRLPFSEVLLETADGLSHSSPVSRTWWASTSALPATMIVSAPGYYSRTLILDEALMDESPLEISLSRQPDTVSLTWGSGEIVLPAETRYNIDGRVIELRSGWVWGSGAGEPFTLRTPTMDLEIDSGRFAVELAPDASGWLYMYEGVASIHSVDGATAAEVQPGEVVRFEAKGYSSPVPVCPILEVAVKDGSRLSFPDIREPNAIQIQINRISELGVSAAMIITLVTYSLGMLLLVLLPLSAISSFRRRR